MNKNEVLKLLFQSECPTHLCDDTLEIDFSFSETDIDKIRQTLNLRETFTRGQIFPYRVEYGGQQQTGVFQEGELHIHHGPLLSLHGQIGTIADDYRGLNYFYGSYVLSFRLIRPVSLEFFIGNTTLKLRLRTFVHPWLRRLWRSGNQFFWKISGLRFLRQ